MAKMQDMSEFRQELIDLNLNHLYWKSEKGWDEYSFVMRELQHELDSQSASYILDKLKKIIEDESWLGNDLMMNVMCTDFNKHVNQMTNALQFLKSQNTLATLPIITDLKEYYDWIKQIEDTKLDPTWAELFKLDQVLDAVTMQQNLKRAHTMASEIIPSLGVAATSDLKFWSSIDKLTNVMLNNHPSPCRAAEWPKSRLIASHIDQSTEK
jgi:hypothetical protein